MDTLTYPLNKEGLIENPTNVKSRISNIDFVRGIVMVIMALDHTRDFFHIGFWQYDATDLSKTTAAVFLTRWITHYCAPAFVFLSGVSAYLVMAKKGKKETSTFLLTRGLWLILLEITVVRLGIIGNLSYDFSVLQVIWAIGISMVIFSALIHLPFGALVTIGFVIVFGHNLLDTIRVSNNHPLYSIWAIVHQGGPIEWSKGKILAVLYPFLPWTGIMTLGFCTGKIYSDKATSTKRKKYLMVAGLSAVGLFILIRGINLYGDPALWKQQKTLLFTVFSFINTTKYPPSLLYSLMTLGPVLIILSVTEGKSLGAFKPFVVFGRVPLFYYVLHFFLIHFLAIAGLVIVGGHSISSLHFDSATTFGGLPNGYGYSLTIVYLIWVAVIFITYPLCNTYNNYKSKHKNWWLSYL